MALLTKKDVAELLGVPTNQLSTMLKRALDKGRVKLTGELLDDADSMNRAFLDYYISKKSNKTEKPQGKTKVPDSKPLKEEVKKRKDPEPKTKFSVGDASKKSANNGNYYDQKAEKTTEETEKIRLEQEKLRIQIRKWRGEVLPTDIVGPLILQHNQSILMESKNTVAEIVRLIAKEKSLTAAQKSRITSGYITALNDSIKKSTDTTIKSLKNIVNEYSERRSIGERN